MKKFIIICAIFILSGCSVLKNRPQESKYMKVVAGGYLFSSERQNEESYSMLIEFKNKPSSAKYLIADFELPNNKGIYERKVFSIDQKDASILIKSDPIYGIKPGLYYTNINLAEDKKGEKIIDSLRQSIQLFAGINKGRDYAKQYTLYDNKKEIKKIIVIFPNKRNNKLISGEISSHFKIGHAAINNEESIIEYVPNKESVYNWTKIISLIENRAINERINKASIHAAVLGGGFYDKFFKYDKDMQITYAAELPDGQFINYDMPNFQELVQKSNEVVAYIDYADYLTAKTHPYQREYLVAKFIKSDISVWNLQCTIRYDKRWTKNKIELLKHEAKSVINNFKFMQYNPIDNASNLAVENGIENFNIKIQRLDDRDLNKEYKEIMESPYKNDSNLEKR